MVIDKFVYTHCNEYRANSKSYLFEFAKADKIGLSKRSTAFRYSIVIIVIDGESYGQKSK